MDFLQEFLSNDFMPHGACFLWRPELVWLHVLGDGFITLAYYSIPLALIYFVQRRQDLAYKWMFSLFGAFILACGTSHLFGIIVLWEPYYWVQGIVKVITAVVSMLTAVLLWPIIPQALLLPSPTQLLTANQKLQQQIIERQQAEERVRASVQVYRTLAQNLPKTAVLLFDQNYRYIIAEGSGLKEQGFEKEMVEGKTIDEVLPPENAAQLRPRYRAALEGRESHFERSHGDRFFDVHIIPVRDEQQGVVGGMIVAHDITEHKRIEADLQAAHDQLEERVKARTEDLKAANEELKTFTYIVSHDLRAPLVNLKGFSQELQYSISDVQAELENLEPVMTGEQQQAFDRAFDEDIPEALDFINTAVNRMDSLTSAVLRLSRLGRQEFHPEHIDMEELVKDTVKALAFQIQQKQVTITIGSLPDVVADRVSMEQIIGNLVTNAVSYLAPERSGHIEIYGERSERSSHHTKFWIKDNGRGIAAYDLVKIFEPFRRAGQQDQPGEGMGLAYVQTLVRRHGGTIWCESELGVGTTFYFTISDRFELEVHA